MAEAPCTAAPQDRGTVLLQAGLTNQHIVITSDHSKGCACFLCTAHPQCTNTLTAQSARQRCGRRVPPTENAA